MSFPLPGTFYCYHLGKRALSFIWSVSPAPCLPLFPPPWLHVARMVSFRHPSFIISLPLLSLLLVLLPACEGILEYGPHEEVVELRVKWFRLETSVRSLAQVQRTYQCVPCHVPFLLFSMHCTVLRSPLPSGSPYFPLALAPCWSFWLGWFLKRQSLLSGSHVWPWVFVSVVIS